MWNRIISLKMIFPGVFSLFEINVSFSHFAQNASKLVSKRSSTMDGQLFLIKHLLILREQASNFFFPHLTIMSKKTILAYWSKQEISFFLILPVKFQIAPFDIEFSVTHKELDFSHLLVSASWTLICLFDSFYYDHNLILGILLCSFC